MHDGGEFARVVTAEPAFVDKHRMRAIQKIFETRLDGGFKAGLHSKRRPALLSIIREMIGKGFWYRRAEKNPDETILFDSWKCTYAMVRYARVSSE